MLFNCETTLPVFKEKAVRQRNFQERSVPKFLKKIFFILEEEKHSELVSWASDGCSMIIKKPTEFADKILPSYFKHSNLASFVRQLNMYNFKKRKNYNYDHEYAHEMFQKGRMNIFRKSTESSPVVKTETPEIKTYKEDIEIDLGELIQENMAFKRLHKNLLTQVHFIENKIVTLRSEINELNLEQQKRKSNEDFLKNIIKNLSKKFGVETIQKIIEAEINEEPSQLESIEEHESSSKPQKQIPTRNHSYASTMSSITDSCFEGRTSHDQGQAQFESYDIEDASGVFDEHGYSNEQNFKLQQTSSILLDNHEEENFDYTRSYSHDLCEGWIDDFERHELDDFEGRQLDVHLKTEENRQSRKFEIGEFFHSENRFSYRESF